MNTDAIFNAAQYAAARILESGAFISPNDTVCAIESSSGGIYTGISRSQMNSYIHAEVDAVQNMLSAGEGIIQAVLLIGIQSRFPLLPCNECVRYILSVAAENASCMILLHDRMININEVGYYAMPSGVPQGYAGNMGANPMQFPNQMNQQKFVPVNQILNNDGPVAETTETNTENASGDFLKNRVNNLLNVAKEPETDEFLESLTPKKKRFGFFRK